MIGVEGLSVELWVILKILFLRGDFRGVLFRRGAARQAQTGHEGDGQGGGEEGWWEAGSRKGPEKRPPSRRQGEGRCWAGACVQGVGKEIGRGRPRRCCGKQFRRGEEVEMLG